MNIRCPRRPTHFRAPRHGLRLRPLWHSCGPRSSHHRLGPDIWFSRKLPYHQTTSPSLESMHLTDAYFFAELQTQLGQSAASGWLRGQLRREFSCSSSNSGTNSPKSSDVTLGRSTRGTLEWATRPLRVPSRPVSRSPSNSSDSSLAAGCLSLESGVALPSN